MKVDRALGHAGRARGEADQGRVGCQRGDRREMVGFACHARFERTAGAIQHQCAQLRAFGRGLLEFVAEARVAERMADPAEADDFLQFLGPQQGHRTDRNATRRPHREPARGKPGGVGTAQQHPIARHQTHVLDQHMRQTAHLAVQLAISPVNVLADDRGPVAMSFRHRALDQFDAGVEFFGKAQFGTVENQFRPLIDGREVVDDESVDMGTAAAHDVSSLPGRLPAFGGGLCGPLLRCRRSRATITWRQFFPKPN